MRTPAILCEARRRAQPRVPAVGTDPLAGARRHHAVLTRGVVVGGAGGHGWVGGCYISGWCVAGNGGAAGVTVVKVVMV